MTPVRSQQDFELGRKVCRARSVCTLLALLNFCGACGPRSLHMVDQPRLESYEESTFFADGSSARPQVAHTVARGQLHSQDALETGLRDGKPLTDLPIQLDRRTVERGRERFEIYCAVCHGLAGYGNGPVVQRGFRAPPSYHSERLRNAPAGHFFDVITHGLGAMPSYANQVEPEDRWAIIAYIRALQLSQHATIEDVPYERRAEFERPLP